MTTFKILAATFRICDNFSATFGIPVGNLLAFYEHNGDMPIKGEGVELSHPLPSEPTLTELKIGRRWFVFCHRIASHRARYSRYLFRDVFLFVLQKSLDCKFLSFFFILIRTTINNFHLLMWKSRSDCKTSVRLYAKSSHIRHVLGQFSLAVRDAQVLYNWHSMGLKS